MSVTISYQQGTLRVRRGGRAWAITTAGGCVPMLPVRGEAS